MWLISYQAVIVVVWFLGSLHQKVSACSLMIKEFCGSKTGWNDRAIFTEIDLMPASESESAALWYSQIFGKSKVKMLHPPPK